MSVRPSHVKLMALFVDNPVVQQHRTDVKGCAKLWERECKRANLPPCSFDDALRAWSAADQRRAGEVIVGPPDLEGMVIVTMRTGQGDVTSTLSARTLYRQALRAYAQTFADPAKFLEDIRLLAIPEARALRPPRPH